MEIKLTPEAHSDLLNIYEFVKKDGEPIAKKQITNIFDGIEQLGTFPNMGAALQKFVKRRTQLRYLVINKVYILIYDVTDAVEVVRVFRKERDFVSILAIGNDDT